VKRFIHTSIRASMSRSARRHSTAAVAGAARQASQRPPAPNTRRRPVTTATSADAGAPLTLPAQDRARAVGRWRCTVEDMPAGDIYTEQPTTRAATVDGGMVLSELIASTRDGGVVYLTDDGDVVAAVAPIEVVEAGLRALGRDRDKDAPS
jgi:hypothetical protein